MAKIQFEFIYLIGNDEEPYEIYIRSAMKIERQRLVLAQMQRRFGVRSAKCGKSFYKTQAAEIYLRLEQLGSFAIDRCGGPKRRNDHPELSEQRPLGCSDNIAKSFANWRRLNYRHLNEFKVVQF